MGENAEAPSRLRMIASAVAVAVFCVAIWSWIEWRSRPPMPPERSIDPFAAAAR